MKDFDSNRIYQTLGDEFKNIYIVDCEDQQIHTFKETLKLPGFSSCTSYNDAMNQYIDDRVYEKNRDMLRMALSFNSLFSRLEKTERFNIHYQSKNDSEVHFMYSHFGRVMEDGRLSQIIIGFANEDLDIRRNNIDMFNNALPSNVVKRKVLIVEDNEINREILKETLEDDYDVIEAVNGEEGLNILSQYYKDISLILLDVVMPVCDGFEFLSRQKSDSLLTRYEGDQLLGLFHSKVKMDVERINRNINKIAEEAPIPNIRIKVGIYEDIDTSLSIPIICDRALMAEKSISKDFKTNVAFYTDEMNQKQLAQRQMENDFKSAIANREFKVYYQPKYDVNTENIVGAEALVRWQKPDGTLISPGAFIPLFESDGLVVRLDEYVFENVCQFQKERMENKLPMVPISVNLSRASIHFNDVVEHYVDIVNQKQIPFECVPIELTESATLYSEKIMEITDQLVKAGFKLHMDDFGSGYSSLTSLNELNFSTVKLDKSLIDYIDQARGKKIVQQAIDLGHGLDMKVVAEGVESKEQKDCLKEMNCDMIQGFYYSKPLKQEDFIEKLR